MFRIILVAVLALSPVTFNHCDGKTAEEWKGRIIYQVDQYFIGFHV